MSLLRQLVNRDFELFHQTCWIALTWHYLRWYCIWAILANIFLHIKDIIIILPFFKLFYHGSVGDILYWLPTGSCCCLTLLLLTSPLAKSLVCKNVALKRYAWVYTGFKDCLNVSLKAEIENSVENRMVKLLFETKLPFASSCRLTWRHQ